MTKRTVVLIILLLLSTKSFSQKPRANIKGDYLLKTAWGGSSPFNAFAPEGTTLGCHANAFAQVMYFHRLAPYGKVSYKCKNGTLISEDFSDYTPQWDTFALNKKSSDENASATEQTARFMYYVASVIRKDFGTDQYVDYADDYHKKAIESHFRCILTAYAKEVKSSISHALKEKIDLIKLMRTEIDAKRPVGFYYTDRKGGGHAVVIDGYTVKNGKIYFHVNFGWFGRSDGWYRLEEDLPKNIKELATIKIVPKSLKRTERKAAQANKPTT
jgi:hypothetical protein